MLRIESSPLMFGLLEPDAPHEAKLGSWTAREIYEPGVYDQIQAGLGRYQIVLEASVETPPEVVEAFSAGVELSEQLEHMWLYATGDVLHGSGFSFSLAKLRVPARWQTNYDDVYREAQRTHSRVIVGATEFIRRTWKYGNALPLKAALDARAAYEHADDVVRSLSELHYHSHTAKGFAESAFLLAKALEIVRKLLPGTKDSERALHLPEAIRRSLRIDLHSLYDLSNNRFDTRHATERGAARSLHPKMSPDELITYIEDADTVVRAVVCQELGLSQVLIESETPTRTA
jgi:hypothetical protein